MNGLIFDAWTKRLADRSTRRAFAGGALGTALLLAGRARAFAALPLQSSADESAGVVRQYYLDIAIYDYRAAWTLLGAKIRAGRSFARFMDGYADTAYVEVETGDVTAAGDHVDVPVTITAWHNDGTIHRYRGAYTVGTEWGQRRLVGASISETARPRDVLPLCRVTDLDARLGPATAGAGNRFGSLVVTNRSDQVCLAAGVPHLKVLDGKDLMIESIAEQTEPITAVPLSPGASAVADFRWTDWCGATPGHQLTVNVAIPGDTDRFSVPAAKGLAVPPCLGEGRRRG